MKYPKVHKVLEIMISDQGMDPLDHLPKLPTHFDPRRRIDWGRVERFLETLTSDELVTFAAGDQEDMMPLAKGRDGKYAHHALDVIFERCII